MKYEESGEETVFLATAPSHQLVDVIRKKRIATAELRLDDGRCISAEQRKKAYATIRDIADYTGYMPEEQKEWLKVEHILRTGGERFSLSNCSMDQAREFINTILEFALENGIPLSERGMERTEDIGRYLYCCLLHKKCAVCGRKGEVHHVDAIGMGNDRRAVDDRFHRKLCLCREHHTMAHQIGMKDFTHMYKVYGIVAADLG